MFQRHQARECSGEPDHEQGDADRLRVGGLHPGELLHDLRRYTEHSQHILIPLCSAAIFCAGKYKSLEAGAGIKIYFHVKL